MKHLNNINLTIMTKFYPFILALFFNLNAFASQKPQIQLANIYHDNINVTQYLVSEKLDGIRAYWDGKNLISRQGKIFHAPPFFIQDFPQTHLEGELWISRNNFELTSSIIRKKKPNSTEWQQVKFMIFDLPKSNLTFTKRYEAMQKIVNLAKSKYLKIIQQAKIDDEKSLMNLLTKTVKKGGEGLMLHKKDSFYKALRNDDILKLKTYQDAEAKILKHLPGKGKYQGMLGAVLVENNEKIRFKIGTGFSDDQRKNPPKIGSIITYKYYGKTKNNKPRFASFMRIRKE